MSTEEKSKSDKSDFYGPKDGGLSKCLQCTKKGDTKFKETKIYRRLPAADDVGIEILCCGICHTDLHWIDNDFQATQYPLVPGHEIVGMVRFTGSNVVNFHLGQRVAVGTYVDCCRKCSSCRKGYPQCCKKMMLTYNGQSELDGAQTFGGFSTFIVVNQHFVYHVPLNLPLCGVAPLLCAGITVFSPLRQWRVGPGSHVGVAGIGGLGHLAVKLARALGAKVTAISHTASKKEESKRLGATNFLSLSDKKETEKLEGTMDVIIDTISAVHELSPYLNLLDGKGTLVLVGVPPTVYNVSPFDLITYGKTISGSNVGSPSDTRELLRLCGMYNITADVEVVGVDHVEDAFKRLRNGDIRYRFVLDIRTLKDGFHGDLLSSTSPSVIEKLSQRKRDEIERNKKLKELKKPKGHDDDGESGNEDNSTD